MHLSKEFFELLKAIGESKSKQEEDRIIQREIATLKKRSPFLASIMTADDLRQAPSRVLAFRKSTLRRARQRILRIFTDALGTRDLPTQNSVLITPVYEKETGPLRARLRCALRPSACGIKWTSHACHFKFPALLRHCSARAQKRKHMDGVTDRQRGTAARRRVAVETADKSCP